VIRQTTKGPLRARVWVREVWVWEDGSARATARRLVVREKEDGELKVSWTNAPKEMSDEELAYMQGQRHWIERGFEDAKSQLGMADYEVRKWRGWHHHMALVALAMLFILKERVEHEESAPLLTRLSILGTYFLANPQNSSIFEVCHPQGLHYTAPLGTSIVSGVNSLGGG
jgi:hypothetical protein